MPTLSDLREQGIGHLQILLYGPPGSGKTVLAHSFPRPRTLDLDDGVRSVLWAIREGVIPEPEDWQYETVKETKVDAHGFCFKPEALDAATKIIDKWITEKDQWDTLIIDSLTSLNTFALHKAVHSMGRLGFTKSKGFADDVKFLITDRGDFKGLQSIFIQFIDWIRSLDKHIVCIAHEYERTDNQGNVLELMPLLSGQLRQRIVKDFDEVWYASTEGVRDKTNFITLTKKDSTRYAKSRLGIFQAKEDFLTFQRIEQKLSAATATTATKGGNTGATTGRRLQRG